MKRKLYKILVASSVVIGILLSTSCEKKSVTQEDVINQQQLVDLILLILDASSPNTAPLDCAMVKVTAGEEVKEKATDATGVASFEDVPIGGNIPVEVTKTNYTTIKVNVNTNPANFRQAVVYATLNLYSLADSLMATITGYVTLESDVTNRESEVLPVGTEIKAYNQSMVGSTTAFVGTTDAEGKYEIMVPVHNNGTNDIVLDFPDIITDQTVAVEDEDDGSLSIVQRETFFSLDQNSEFGAIPVIPSAWATIDPPSAATGSGLTLGSAVNPTTLIKDQSLIVNVTNGGSGYTDGYNPFDFSEGINGLTAQLLLYAEDGALSMDDVANPPFISANDALYRSMPTVDLNVGGSGGQVSLKFSTTYDIYISNGGSNYVGFPVVYGQATAYNSDEDLVTVTDDNINDGTSDYFGTFVLNFNATINGGIIESASGFGDTISTSSYLASAPTFGISYTPKATPAEITLNINANDSVASSITINNAGSNYDPTAPPVVTIFNLPGFSTDATAVAEVGTNRSISAIEITNMGSGYVQNANDFSGNGVTWDTEEQPSPNLGGGVWMIYNLAPGNTYFQDAHYGTGTPTEMDD
jgi:hypothetical protein